MTGRSGLQACRTTHTARAVTLLWVLACVAVLPGCSSCGSSSAPAGSSSAAPVALAPVAAPTNLLADIYIPHPTKTWSAVRDAVGGPIMLLPASYQMLATTMLGLAPQVAGLIDADIAVVGAVVNDESGAPTVVLGMHVRDPRELVANLVTGSDARFRAVPGAPGAVEMLEPVPGKASKDVRLGVVGSYLLAASDASALESAGPYVGRTLPKRSMPGGGVVLVAGHKALAGPIAARVNKAWQAYRDKLVASDQALRAQHGGRAPDFGDPTAAMLGAGAAVESFVAVLQTTDELRLVVDPLEGRVDARLEMSPSKSGAAADLVQSMVVGPMQGLTALPLSTGVAVESRTSKASRAESAKSTAGALAKLFGDWLKDADRKKLDTALDDFAAGRGDDVAAAIVSGGAGSGLVVRSSVADANALRRAVKSGWSLLAVPAISAPLERFIGKVHVKLSTTKVDGVAGKVDRALITVKSGSAPDRPQAALSGTTKLEVVWTVTDGVAYGALAKDAGPVLGELFAAGASSRTSLAADVPAAQAAARVGASATFALLADPGKLGIAPGGGKQSAAPIVLALGRDDGRGWLRVELPQAALRGVLRFAMHPGPR